VKKFLTVFACIVVCGLLAVVGIAMIGKNGKVSTRTSKATTFAQARKEFKTELKKSGPSPGQYENSVPDGVEVVNYASDGRKLMAWMAYPTNPGKRPAVLFAHGGDSLGEGDFDSCKPFVNAGFAVMMPAWRGENGNPGSYEMCYGEVEDAKNAIAFLKKNPRIDPKNIYAAGHSIGGTVVMLLSEVSPDLKKAAACGGFPNMYDARNAYENPPFEINGDELRMRSPGEWVTDLKCPLLLVYGETDPGERLYQRQAEDMERVATRKSAKPITIKTMQGKDHFSALEPAVGQMVSFFVTN